MSWAAVAVAGGAIAGGALAGEAAKDASNIQAGAGAGASREQVSQNALARADLAPYRDTGQAAIRRIGELLGISQNIKQPTWEDAAAEHLRSHKERLGVGYVPGETPMDVVQAETQSIYNRMQQEYERQKAQPAMTPTSVMEMDPGYQFRLQEGLKSGRNIAGARGMLNSGATLKGLTRYGQDYASSEFGNIYNRLANTAGMGQGAVNTGVNSGMNMAGNVGNYLTGTANARGAAAIGQANAYGGALNTVGNYYAQQATLDKLLNQNRGSTFGGYGGASPY